MGNLRKSLAILCTIAILLALNPPVSVLADGPVGGFDQEDFERIAEGGFGDEMNNYAWSMGYFKGDLYVGVGRNSCWGVLNRMGLPSEITDVVFEEITVPTIDPTNWEEFANDMRGEIWRYHDSTWERVYQASVFWAPAQQRWLTSEIGFRGPMVTFTDKWGEEAIYTARAGALPPNNVILKSTDGVNWERVRTPSIICNLPPYMGTPRAMAVHNGKLYVGAGEAKQTGGGPFIWATDDPVTATDLCSPPHNWELVADFSGFGPGTNTAVGSLASFNGYLYAGLDNKETGFQVWRSNAQSPSDPSLASGWTQIVNFGAGDMHNWRAACMDILDNQLYVGSLSLPGGPPGGAPGFLLPKGFEIIRIDTSDDWELVVGDYLARVPPPSDGWWNNEWKYRQKLTFDNSGRGQLDNLPVLVKLTDPERIDYSKTEPNGEDIRFVDDNNTTELSYEIEEWNDGGTSWVWVKVPQIDAGSTSDFIYMYYGSLGATDNQDPPGVWNPFIGVWHLEETGTGTRYDSTSNSNNGTPSGYEGDEATTGKIDGSDDFDGTDDYVGAPGADFDGLGTMTVEAWVKFDTFGAWKRYVSKWEIDYTFNLAHTGGNLIRFEIGTSGGNVYFDSTTTITGSNWHYTVGVYDGSKLEIYIDGTKESGSSSQSGTSNTGSQNVGIGHDIGVTGNWMDGVIDEVRISDSARSADWIAAQYLSMTDNFITYGELPDYALRLPISGWPGGFGNFLNWYCWSMQAHEDVLYVGSFDTSSFLQLLPVEDLGEFIDLTTEQLVAIGTSLEEVIDLLEELEVDEYYIEAFERLLEAFDVGAPEDIDWEEVWQVCIDYFTGADLWKTEDGIYWEPVTLNGFDNPDNYGFRNMVGVNPLFVGTANPFEGGGLEIWQAPLPPPYVGGVGGEVYPINKLGILAPWIGLAMLLIGSIACLTLRRRRAQS